MAGTGSTSIRSYDFFVGGAISGVAATGLYAENAHEFVDTVDGTPFLSHTVVIENTGAENILFRFSAASGAAPVTHGIVLPTETIQFDFKRARRIYLSGIVAASAFRVWAR